MGLLSFRYMYVVEGYITYKVYVKTGDFSGATSLCVPIAELVKCIKDLEQSQTKLTGNVTLTDTDSDSYITFEYLNYGHAEIYGQLGGSYNDLFVKFRFQSDQTQITEIINNLKCVLSAKSPDN